MRSIAVLVVASVGAGPALAQHQPKAEPTPEHTATGKPLEWRWYGWQTLGVDVLAAALALAVSAESVDPDYPYYGLIALGSPAVHLAHARPGSAGASLAMRVMFPLLLGYRHDARCDDVFENRTECRERKWEEMVKGAAIAVVADAAVLTWERVRASSDPSPTKLPWLAVDIAAAYQLDMSESGREELGGGGVHVGTWFGVARYAQARRRTTLSTRECGRR